MPKMSSDSDTIDSHADRRPSDQFNIHDVIDQIDTSTFVLAMGDETGYGWHADFFNGWDDGAIPELLKTCPQGQYGNEDIGGCPSYKGFATIKAEQCKLPGTYKENVQSPGKALPGCNPISDVNPAPKLAVSPLGVFTTQCKAGAGGPPAAPPPSGGSTTKRPATTAAITTMATQTKPASPVTSATTTGVPGNMPPKQRGKASCPKSNGKTIVKNGKTFKIECGIDHQGGDLVRKTAHSLGECIKFCARTKGCVDVSLSGTACYLKKELGKAVPMEGLAGAKLVSGGAAATPSSYTLSKREAHLHRHVHKQAGL